MKKIDLSVIIPCLNEENGVGVVVNELQKTLKKIRNVRYEILVVDNGSTDASAIIAKHSGAKVVNEHRRGYGRAYRTGLTKARGDVLVMVDADGTYDVSAIPAMYRKIRHGADIVIGNRFGHDMTQDAMPFLNRRIGNPLLTSLVNLFYGCRITDTQSGFRMFTKNAWKTMKLKSSGMEFATEMIIKAITYRIPIVEVPVRYRPRIGVSKLSPVADALRHIQSILMFSPSYALILPGSFALIIGVTLSVLFLSDSSFFGKFYFGIHSLIAAITLATLGVSILLTGLFARLYSVRVLEIPGGFSHGLSLPM